MNADPPASSDWQTCMWRRWTWDIDQAMTRYGDHPSQPFDVPRRPPRPRQGHHHRRRQSPPLVDLDQAHLVAPFPNAQDGCLIIDGWPRTGRALQESHDQLPAIFLSEEQSAAARSTR